MKRIKAIKSRVALLAKLVKSDWLWRKPGVDD